MQEISHSVTAGPGSQPAGASQSRLAWRDLEAATRGYWLWNELAVNDIRQRYRGSVLGPFWLTLSMAVFISGLGPLYSSLFGLDTRSYLPFMALGILIWQLITTTINESARAFVDAGPLMKLLKLPRLSIIFHIIWRNIIVFAHHVPVYLVVVIYAGVSPNGATLWVVPGLVLLVANLLWISLLVAIVCLRFLDVIQIVSGALTLGFFFTPVIWNHRLQKINPWVVNLNPFASFIELVRAPLLGEAIPTSAMLISLLCLVVGGLLTGWLFVRVRKQLIYWI